MAPTPKVSTVTIRDMYERERLSLREIAKRCGLSFQTVHGRLVKAGVEFRPKFTPQPFEFLIDKAVLLSLYVDKRMSVQAIADQLGLSHPIVEKHFKFHEIPRRPRGGGGVSRKYPELAVLKVGESVILPRDDTEHPHRRFHAMAQWFGIKVSVRIVDEKSMRITRKK